jgi:hypothetical protein
MDAVDAVDARIAQLDGAIAALQAERAALQVERAALQTERNARTPIGRLPPEVLAKVMRYFCDAYDVYGTDQSWPFEATPASERLDFARDIHAIASVSRQLRRASTSLLWKYSDTTWNLSSCPSLGDLHIVLSEVSDTTDFTAWSRATCLFLVLDIHDVWSNQELYFIPIRAGLGCTEARIQLSRHVREAEAFDQILDQSTWSVLTKLTLDGSGVVLDNFAVYMPSLEHLELNNCSFPLDTLCQLVDEAPHLSSITFVNVTAAAGDEDARPTPVEHKTLVDVHLEGGADAIASALTLVPYTTKNLEIELTRGERESKEDTDVYDVIMNRVVDFWRRAHGTAHGFSPGAVYVGTAPHTLIHFWGAHVPGLPRLSWKIFDLAPVQTPKSLLQHVHVLELDCQSGGFADSFVECLPIWPRLTAIRILYLDCRQEGGAMIGRTLLDWLLERAQKELPLPSVHFRCCSADSKTWFEQLVDMGWNTTITWVD